MKWEIGRGSVKEWVSLFFLLHTHTHDFLREPSVSPCIFPVVTARWWPPPNMWAGPLIFYGHHWGCLNNPISSNLGLCAAFWAHFMCHHKLCPTSVSHPFSSLNSYLGLTGGKYYPKNTIPIFILQNFPFPGCFSYILLSFLSSGWVVIAVCDSISVYGTS